MTKYDARVTQKDIPDIEQWGTGKGNLIAPLPMVYSPTPTDPANAPIIQVAGNTGPTGCLTPQSDYSMPTGSLGQQRSMLGSILNAP
jgi:hypothetical protein